MNPTLERAKALGAPFACQICGEEERLTWTEDRQKLLAHHRICFGCCFWVERFWTHMTDPESIICGQEAYTARSTPAGTRFRGYGGRRFTFETTDGRTVESTDVWHQGRVPDRFAALLPDNALMKEPW